MKASRAPIEIPVFDGEKQYIYFEHSILIDMLAYYPYMQLSIIGLFVVISYFAFSSSRNAEQNQVWVGMSKETAHQLGTPLSSLMGWVEYLKTSKVDASVVEEISKDVSRLETIADRFSKIGSDPKFESVSVMKVIDQIISYLRLRISDKVKITVMYRGREMARQDMGVDTLNRVVDILDDFAEIDKQANMEGRRLSLILSPK